MSSQFLCFKVPRFGYGRCSTEVEVNCPNCSKNSLHLYQPILPFSSSYRTPFHVYCCLTQCGFQVSLLFDLNYFYTGRKKGLKEGFNFYKSLKISKNKRLGFIKGTPSPAA